MNEKNCWACKEPFAHEGQRFCTNCNHWQGRGQRLVAPYAGLFSVFSGLIGILVGGLALYAGYFELSTTLHELEKKQEIRASFSNLRRSGQEGQLSFVVRNAGDGEITLRRFMTCQINGERHQYQVAANSLKVAPFSANDQAYIVPALGANITLIARRPSPAICVFEVENKHGYSKKFTLDG
ncbi:hypothetical protein [Polycladidibacter hongkongensis]|uniref:hypothetical protein n=1 Tax=Polycladidibacter hongkongensis TaxID=1647556 RepID=UPI00082A1A7C|nr:hypothetical protein [Pseudovibrio hongkongensis]